MSSCGESADEWILPKTIMDLTHARAWRDRLEAARARVEWLEKVSAWYELEDALGKEPWARVDKISVRLDWVGAWEQEASFVSLAFLDGSVWKESLGTGDDRQCLCSKATQVGEARILERSREAEKSLRELRAALEGVVGSDWGTLLEDRGPMEMTIENFKAMLFSPEEIAVWEFEALGAEARSPRMESRKRKGL